MSAGAGRSAPKFAVTSRWRPTGLIAAEAQISRRRARAALETLREHGVVQRTVGHDQSEQWRLHPDRGFLEREAHRAEF